MGGFRKWTVEEESALKSGIAKHGIGKWCRILEDPEFGGILHSRKNGSLKDKWKSLRMAANGCGSQGKGMITLKNSRYAPKRNDNLLSPEVEDFDDYEYVNAPLSVPSETLHGGRPKESMLRKVETQKSCGGPDAVVKTLAEWKDANRQLEGEKCTRKPQATGLRKGCMLGKGGKRNSCWNYRGAWQRALGNWAGGIRKPNRGRRVWLGIFPTALEDAIPYDEAVRTMYGSSASLNFPVGGRSGLDSSVTSESYGYTTTKHVSNDLGFWESEAKFSKVETADSGIVKEPEAMFPEVGFKDEIVSCDPQLLACQTSTSMLEEECKAQSVCYDLIEDIPYDIRFMDDFLGVNA